jgi:hypothetical protein
MGEKLKLKFEGKCILKLEHDPDTLKTPSGKPILTWRSTITWNARQYIGPDELPTSESTSGPDQFYPGGFWVASAHQKGYKDSAENLRFIISELQRGFIHVVDITEENFK